MWSRSSRAVEPVRSGRAAHRARGAGTRVRAARASARRRARRSAAPASPRAASAGRAARRPVGRRRVGDDQQRAALGLRRVPGVEQLAPRPPRSASSMIAPPLSPRRSARAGCGPTCAGRPAARSSPARRPSARAGATARAFDALTRNSSSPRIGRPGERQGDLVHHRPDYAVRPGVGSRRAAAPRPRRMRSVPPASSTCQPRDLERGAQAPRRRRRSATRITDTPPSARLVVAAARTPGTPRTAASVAATAPASGVSNCSDHRRADRRRSRPDVDRPRSVVVLGVGVAVGLAAARSGRHRAAGRRRAARPDTYRRAA